MFSAVSVGHWNSHESLWQISFSQLSSHQTQQKYIFDVGVPGHIQHQGFFIYYGKTH